MKKLAVVLVLTMLSTIGVAAPDNAEVYIISPQNSATVSTTFDVIFGLKNMGVAPAGIEKTNTGHHHLLIDVDKLPEAGQPILADKQHLHFGGGQTQATITLEKGTHTLQLIFADHNHVPFDPAIVSKKITVIVK